MTTVSSIDDFLDEFRDLLETKENPGEWYVVSGKQVGEYSIHSDEMPEEYTEEVEGAPSAEARDATENVDGFYQIGTAGWSAEAFDDEVEFVKSVSFSSTFGKVDHRINDLLLVHESVLSEKALDVAEAEPEEVPEP